MQLSIAWKLKLTNYGKKDTKEVNQCSIIGKLTIFGKAFKNIHKTQKWSKITKKNVLMRSNI